MGIGDVTIDIPEPSNVLYAAQRSLKTISDCFYAAL